MIREPAHCLRCEAELLARRGQLAKCAHAEGLCIDCWLTPVKVPGPVCSRCLHSAGIHGPLTGRTPPPGVSCRMPGCACIGGYSPREES